MYNKKTKNIQEEQNDFSDILDYDDDSLGLYTQDKFGDNLYKRNINGNKIEISDNKLYINGKYAEIPNHVILDIVGNGDNAAVFRAKHNITNQIYALKIWLPNYEKGKTKSNKSRSIEEVKKMAQLDHNRITKIYECGLVNGFTYSTMELVKGRTLTNMLRYNIDLSERYKFIMQILQGLRYCHEKGIYHGDLHKENILITDTNEIKLLDFGTSHFSKGDSNIRGNRIMLKTGLTIMGEYSSKKLLYVYGGKIESLPPHCVRMIIKALVKVSTLLNFTPCENVVKDIALFITIVPFFNLKEVVVDCQVKLTPFPDFLHLILTPLG